MQRKYLALPFVLLPLALGSCGDEEIRTYKVASDTSSPATANAPAADPIGQAPAAEAPHDHAAHSNSVTWNALEGWQKQPAGQFLTAAYSAPDSLRVTVSKLGGDGGGLAANINRWRGQVGLESLAEDKIGGQPMKIADSEEGMRLYNLAPDSIADDANGILAAVLPLAGETWYFKMTGPAAAIRKNGAAFMEFLRTVRVAGANPTEAHAQPEPEKPAVQAPAKPAILLSPPEGWMETEGSAMRAASFGIVDPKGISADVSVIPLAGDSGTVLDNVNRWRAQIKLAAIDSAEDPELGTKIEGPAGEYFLTHMVSTKPLVEGKKAAISTAILKKGNVTWFFKMSGVAELVAANRDEFEAFVRSATFP